MTKQLLNNFEILELGNLEIFLGRSILYRTILKLFEENAFSGLEKFTNFKISKLSIL